MDLLEVKTIKQCIDTVTTDTYGDEITSSWEDCLDEIFDNVEAELAGQPVKVIGFCGTTKEILAKCRWKKTILRVTLDSLTFKNLNANQKLWLKAYLKWQSQGWTYYA
jgi:hypothetical protein